MSHFACVVGLLSCTALFQDGALPPPAGTPWLQLDPGAASGAITATAFAHDGKTLFVAGLDKVVRIYSMDGPKPALRRTLRVPIGPGNAGGINALAISADDRWLAVGGRAPMRDEAGFGHDGIVVDTRHLPPAMRRDVGVIYLVDLTNPVGGTVLRGHRAEVRALAFVMGAKEPTLVSAAVEPDDAGNDQGTLRVWDVGAARETAMKRGFPAVRTRPGLVAWRSRAPNETTQVAVAWPDQAVDRPGVLRVWDVAGGQVSDFAIGRFNLPLTVEKDTNGAVQAIVAAGYDNAKGGVLVRHPVTALDKPTRTPWPREGSRVRLPRAVAALPGGALAVLVESADSATNPPLRQLRLHVVSSSGQVSSGVELRQVDFTQTPVLAAAPDGRHLAVAAFQDRRVEIHTIKDQAADPTIKHAIPGANAGFHQAAFLKGQRMWFGQRGELPERGGIVFDLVGRQVLANDGRQEVDTLPAVAMAVAQANGRATVTVSVQGHAVSLVLRPGERPTAVAVAPAGVAWLPIAAPVVAVAHSDDTNAVTMITLFNAATGQRLRQLIGPLQPVHHLAFSGSRPLLAGTGQDAFAMVWSLRDLNKQVGGIEGLQVTDRNGTVAVAAIEGNLGNRLAVGDLIEAVGPAAPKLVPIKSMADFVLNLRLLPVGEMATLRVRGKGDLEVRLGLAVEQRGPLFSLWIEGDKDADARRWVGWSPAGPYDASSEQAEERIGWHTNTGDAANPVTYAGAAQYRKNYYRHDLLRFLFEKGELAAALDSHDSAYPPTPPRLWALVHGDEGGQAGRCSMVRTTKAELEMDFDDARGDFPLDHAVLRYRAKAPNGQFGAWSELPVAGAARPWRVRLDDHPWQRGRHTFEVALHRTPTSPASIRAVAEADFVPPPPQVNVAVDGKPVEGREIATEQEAVRVSANVADREPIRVELQWLEPDGETINRRTLERRQGVDYQPVDLPLAPGVTDVRIIARPVAVTASAPDETTTVSFRVERRRPRAAPAPRIPRLDVVPAGETRAEDGQEMIVVDRADLALHAEVQSDAASTTAEWDLGDGNWQKAASVEGQFRRSLQLVPGRTTTVRIRAKVDGSEYATRGVKVVFYPPLPRIRVHETHQLTSTIWPLTFLFGKLEGAIPPGLKLGVEAKAAGEVDLRQYEAVVDAANRMWWVGVPLKPGTNCVSLQVSSMGRHESLPDFATIEYRRPPCLLASNLTADAAVAWVVAAESKPPVAMGVNQQRDGTTKVECVGSWLGCGLYRVRVMQPGRFFAAGKSEHVVVAIHNDDGVSRTLALRVPTPVRKLQPPRLEIEGGTQDRNTDRERFTLAYRIATEHPILGLEVVAVAGEREEPASKVAIDEATVQLRPGVNRVKIRVQNQDGLTEAIIQVAFTPRPVKIVIEGLDELDNDGQSRQKQVAILDTSGRVKFAPCQSGWINVLGRVRCASPDDPLLRQAAATLQLAVNGVVHLPVPLEPPLPGASERSFRAPVFLNATENTLQLSLQSPVRGVAQEVVSGLGETLTLDCTKPLGRQRLHVVVIGVDLPTTERFALARRVLRALGGTIPFGQAEYFDRGEFQMAAFDEAVLYPPLVGEVIDLDVKGKLATVNREVARRSRLKGRTWLNDVVLVYYQGADAQGADGRRWLHTSQSLARDPRSVLRDALAIDELPRTPGVRLLLLNVVAEQSESDAGPARMVDSEPMLRYVWREPQATDRLLSLLQGAVGERTTWGAVAEQVRAGVVSDPRRGGDPLEVMPVSLSQRRIGGGGK
jgi:WD40 repeat protein